MPKKQTQEEVIAAFKEAQKDRKIKYDYSHVHYVNNTTPVEIICPIHGSFMQTPKNHKKGRGCPLCVPNHKMGAAEFMKKLKNTFGDRYDYSQTHYINYKTKVIVICPKHGPFSATPNSLLMHHGCPKCGIDANHTPEANKKRSQHAIATFEAKTGYKTRSSMPGEAQKMFGVGKPAVLSNDTPETLFHRFYGDDTPMPQWALDYLTRNWSVIKTRDEYAVKSDLSQRFKNDGERGLGAKSVREKAENTTLEEYGSRNFMQSKDAQKVIPEIVEKGRQTQMKEFGAPHYSQSKEYRSHIKEYKRKEYETRKAHGTLGGNTSHAEDKVYKLLCKYFDPADIVRQYGTDPRYPYNCDFYIKSRDMFIEYNGTWYHGNHWYEASNSADIAQVRQFLVKSKSPNAHKKGKKFLSAIQTWTQRDVAKRQCAKQHKLNYVVFWGRADLLDVVLWIAMGCPNAQDWQRMYSWLPTLQDLRQPELPKRNPFKGNKSIIKLVTHYQFDVFYKREIDAYNDMDWFKIIRLFHNRQKYSDLPVTNLTVRNFMKAIEWRKGIQKYSSFFVDLMDQVIDKYDIHSVVDPCAGWGERMVDCCKHDVQYFGYDINNALKDGYDEMMHDFNMTKQHIRFADSASDDVGFPVNANAVITCPPYFNTEIYSGEGAENLSHDEFLRWWNKIGQKAFDANIKYFCFQIAEGYKAGMLPAIEKVGYKLIDCLDMPDENSKNTQYSGILKKHEQMLVLQRIDK